MSGTSVKGILERYDSNPTLIAGELAKKNMERKMLHEILTEFGIISESADQTGMCLINRVIYAAEGASKWYGSTSSS